ncbi:hypothetical protein DL98DRAFT_95200 [Cadophora sp. DSE1049]|nr:hypothetical protein DL98DRAFT_95200 [Cadophora sp. DSE1049]
MGNIYRRARQVVVWLGPEADKSSLALELIGAIGGDLKANTSSMLSVKYQTPDSPVRIFWESEERKEYWNAFLKLLKRPWFTRLWVFQETQLAARGLVVAGSHTAPLIHLTLAVHRLNFVLFNNKVKGLHAFDPTKISNIQDLLWPVQRGTDPHKLISLTRSLSCLDPRDRVYGLLSLFPLKFKFPSGPDYTSKVEDVYKDFFLALLLYSKTASFDQVSGNGCSSLSSRVASWIPDIGWQGSDFPKSHANGVHVDNVKLVGAPISLGATVEEILRIVRRWEQLVLDGVHSHDGDTLDDNQRATLDQFITTVTCQITEAMIEKLISKEEWLYRRRVEYMACMNGTYEDLSVARVVHRMCYYLPGRTFFMTEEGRMGLGPSSTALRDGICVGLGCSNLLVLHPIRNPLLFRIRGDACIPGLMNGEGIADHIILETEWVQITNNGVIDGYSVVLYTWGPIQTQFDPRRGRLPSPWEMLYHFGEYMQEDEFDDNGNRGLLVFYHKDEDRIQHQDPRLTAANLRDMGVKVQDLVII